MILSRSHGLRLAIAVSLFGALPVLRAGAIAECWLPSGIERSEGYLYAESSCGFAAFTLLSPDYTGLYQSSHGSGVAEVGGSGNEEVYAQATLVLPFVVLSGPESGTLGFSIWGWGFGTHDGYYGYPEERGQVCFKAPTVDEDICELNYSIPFVRGEPAVVSISASGGLANLLQPVSGRYEAHGYITGPYVIDSDGFLAVNARVGIVPEPASLLLIAAGLGALGRARAFLERGRS